MSTVLPAYRRWAATPALEPIEYSVVIPAHNEAERILPTVGAIATHMSSLGKSWELIVADDGSTDETVALLEELELVNMHVLRAEANGGKGSAVRRGMFAARGQVILFADADQSTPIEQFDDLVSRIDDGYDVAIGSRSVDGATVTNKSLMRNSPPKPPTCSFDANWLTSSPSTSRSSISPTNSVSALPRCPSSGSTRPAQPSMQQRLLSSSFATWRRSSGLISASATTPLTIRPRPTRALGSNWFPTTRTTHGHQDDDLH